jgi:hypothetical protein
VSQPEQIHSYAVLRNTQAMGRKGFFTTVLFTPEAELSKGSQANATGCLFGITIAKDLCVSKPSLPTMIQFLSNSARTRYDG